MTNLLSSLGFGSHHTKTKLKETSFPNAHAYILLFDGSADEWNYEINFWLTSSPLGDVATSVLNPHF